MTDSSKAFIKGATILAVTGLVARFIGALFRIVLAAILGDEGIGLYMYAYPVYSTLLVISTAGIPVALSKLMAEKIALNDFREALRIFKVAFFLLTLTGLAITLVLLLGAELFADYIVKDMQAVLPLMAIAPAIFFVTVMASLRGFFQGQQNMLPTASSQLLEQLVRVGFSIILVILLLPVGLEYAAAGATSGAAAGGLGGLIFLSIFYLRSRKKLFRQAEKQESHNPDNTYRIIASIFRLAIPVTIGGLVIPLISLIDLAVVPRQLQAAGFDLETSRALYGQLTGMAGPIVYFPNVIALALSISLVPAISEAYALQDRRLIQSRAAIAIKLTVLFSLPSAIGLFLLAEPITLLLYNNAAAGYSLAYMSWSVIPLCLYVTTTGLLQGLGRPITPALNMVYGGIVKTLFAWFLTAIPELNVGGAALASVIGIGVAAALNLYHVNRYTGWRANLRELLLFPGAAAIVMAIFVYMVYRFMIVYGEPFLSAGRLNVAATLLSIIVGMLIYTVVLLMSGGLNRDEVSMLPVVGSRLASFTKRFGLLKGPEQE